MRRLAMLLSPCSPSEPAPRTRSRCGRTGTTATPGPPKQFVRDGCAGMCTGDWIDVELPDSGLPELGDDGIYWPWDELAECESGGDWSINTGNGYYGGLQFALGSWQAAGGTGYPHEHSPAEQIRRGEILQDIQGWGAWPTCARIVGLL